MSKKSTALIIYHSNTGNTAALADQAAKTLKELNWNVSKLIMDNSKIILPEETPDLLIVGSPVHFWQIPVPVIKMIRMMPHFNNVPAFIYLTYGTVFDGDAPYQLANEVSKLGADIIGGASILSPHNFMTQGRIRLGDRYKTFGKDQPDQHVLESFNKAIINAAEKTKQKKHEFDIDKMRSPKPVTTFIGSLLPVNIQRKTMPKVKWDQPSCINCKKCISSCPTGSISLVDGKIVTNHNTCYRCYQCLWSCEADARKANLSNIADLLKVAKKFVKNPGSRIFE